MKYLKVDNTDIQKDQIYRQIDMYTYIDSQIHIDRQIVRYIYRQIDRQLDRQLDIQIEDIQISSVHPIA